MKEEWVYGIHVVNNLLEQAPERVLEISIVDSRKDERIQEIRNRAKALQIALHPLSKKQIDILTEEGVPHQGVAARIRPKPNLTEQELTVLLDNLKTHPLLLVLDNIQDPHNLGASLRTADAAGVTAVIIPKDRSAKVTPAVRKVASGAAESVPIVEVTNLVRCLENLKKRNIWVLGATAEPTQTLFEADLRVPLALVFGKEDTGMRRLTAETCDALIRIPMFGVVKSLNVSVAVSICVYEAIRQRTK